MTHSSRGGCVRGSKFNELQSKFVVFLLSSFFVEFVTETPFFVIYYLRLYLQQMRLAVPSEGSPHASDKRGQCKKLWRQKAVGYARRRYTMEKYFSWVN